jgi:hypothetical protein
MLLLKIKKNVSEKLATVSLLPIIALRTMQTATHQVITEIHM